RWGKWQGGRASKRREAWRMRDWLCVTVCTFFSLCTGTAQDRPCTVPVNVAIPVWSSLGSVQADDAIRAWKQDSRIYRASRPGWQWVYVDFISGSGSIMLPDWTLV